MPDLPDVGFWSTIFKDALVIALIAFSINASLGTLFARKNKYRIYPTQVRLFFFYYYFLISMIALLRNLI